MLPGFAMMMGLPTLNDLGGTSTAAGGTVWTWNIPGRAAGSTIIGSSSDGNVVTDRGGYIDTVFNNFGGNRTATVALTETLEGSANSPRSSTITVDVTAAP